jgi:hypothetical protein
MDSSDDSKNFFKHVFNFDDDSKGDMLNIIQYSTLAIVPVVILNKIMQKYVPEADEQKGSVEILAEILIQIIGMFIGLLIIHRMIIFVPTYSGAKYPDFNLIFIILGVLMIVLGLQTKLGEKVTLIVDRVNELWNGPSSDKNKNKKGNGNVKVTQPISQQNQMPSQTVMNQALYSDGTSINSLPTADMSSSSSNTMAPLQLPNYNTMHRQDTTPLVNAATPGMGMEGMMSEPMAANGVLGGSFSSFGSW